MGWLPMAWPISHARMPGSAKLGLCRISARCLLGCGVRLGASVGLLGRLLLALPGKLKVVLSADLCHSLLHNAIHRLPPPFDDVHVQTLQ
ncbi:MAG: hypothetical protein H7A43_12190 [Verrucomicrobia bacterium]|nr:hypothetical protein [Verrucomicrobiota bacterium]